MGMCKWFFEDATKIQNGRQKSNPKNFVGAKTLKLMSEIILISLSHSPPYGDVQVTFSRFYWNSKWPPRISFNFLVGAKTQKISLVNFLARLLILIKKGGLLQLKFGVVGVGVGVGVNIYLWAR